MAYVTDLGSVGVIDDGNYTEYVEELKDLSGPFGSGLVERDYRAHGLGSYAPVFKGDRLSRSKWDDAIKRQDDNESSPWHHHKASDVPILDQNGYPYCWCFGLTAAVMNRYAISGLPVPFLSATAVAAQVKNFRQVGGWAGEAVEGFHKFGCPTIETWPQHSLDRSLPNNHEQQLDAKRHDITAFEELPSRDFEMAMSALLHPLNPSPVTMGLMWWGHLVCGLRAVKISAREYGILIVNSWKKTWGDGGFKVLAESKATAHEYIAVRGVTARAA